MCVCVCVCVCVHIMMSAMICMLVQRSRFYFKDKTEKNKKNKTITSLVPLVPLVLADSNQHHQRWCYWKTASKTKVKLTL